MTRRESSPGSDFSDETTASLLALTDVMSTGYHAAIGAGVREGQTVAGIGDGTVGTFYRNIGNIGMRGGAAPARAYQPEPLEAVLAGRIDPGRVCDFTTDLDHVTDTEYLGSSN